MGKLPPRLKPLTPFQKRADELDRVGDVRSRTMSYFCRSWAMELGIGLNDNSSEVQTALLDIMNRLESDKTTLPEVNDKEKSKAFVENFAYTVFQKADDEDRSGNANKSTARTFYAASTFFEVLKQFAEDKELEEDVKQTSMYAKWKAADILKCIKAGVKPNPGPPVGDDDEDDAGGAGSGGAGGSGGGGGGGGGIYDIPAAPTDIPAAPTGIPVAPTGLPYDIPAAPTDIPAAPTGIPVAPMGLPYDIPAAPTDIPAAPTGTVVGEPQAADDPYAAMAAKLASQLPDAEPEAAPTAPPTAPTLPPAAASAPPPAAAAAPRAAVASSRRDPPPSYASSAQYASKDSKSDALEFARYGVRALEKDNIPLAIERLQQAIAQLTGGKGGTAL